MKALDITCPNYLITIRVRKRRRIARRKLFAGYVCKCYRRSFLPARSARDKLLPDLSSLSTVVLITSKRRNVKTRNLLEACATSRLFRFYEPNQFVPMARAFSHRPLRRIRARIHVYPDIEDVEREERRPWRDEGEGHSIMFSTTWPLTVRRGEGCARKRVPCARMHSRHQTSYIDHVIGPPDTHAIGPSI